MKITEVRVYELQGVLEHEEEFWEERLVRPLDIYPEHKAEGAHEMFAVGGGRYRISAYFVDIDTDEGVSGRAGRCRANRLSSSRRSWRRCCSAMIRWPPSACGTGCTGRRCTAARVPR